MTHYIGSGNTVAGFGGTLNADQEISQRYVADLDGTVFTARFNYYQSLVGDVRLRVYLYDDAALAPNNLLGSSSEITIPMGSAAGWYTLPWPTGPTLVNGTAYWIAVHADIDVQYQDAGGALDLQYNNQPYSSGPANPFGPTDAGNAPQTMVQVGIPDAPPPTPSQRFYQGYPWKFIFTDLSSVVTTWALGLLTNRTVVRTLSEAGVIDFSVWPDDIRVNEIWTDGYPRLAQTIRMVHAFRREGNGPNGLPGDTAPWRIREAGILMSPEDQGTPDIPLSHFTAFGPRKYLDARPCVDAAGRLPGPLGFTNLFLGAADGATLAAVLLANTIADVTYGGPVHIDAGTAYGGTPYWAGTIDPTVPIVFQVQQGQTVGDAWQQLEATGTMEIVLNPIWDPVRRPGYTHELSIFALAGSHRRSAVFGWDKMNRAVTNISRQHDATPGSFFNIVQYYAGQGGPPVPPTPLVNLASQNDFGSWWSQQFFPNQVSSDPLASSVYYLAVLALQLAKQGKRTVTMLVTPERAPVALLDYDIGDRVPVYATNRLRAPIAGLIRVQSIPITITDDGIEQVLALLLSPDWAVSPNSFT